MLLKSVILFAASICCSECFLFQNYNLVNIKLINGPNLRNYSQYGLNDLAAITANKHFNARLPTMLYVFGWLQSLDAETTVHLMNAYLKLGGYNVLLLDWSEYNVGTYTATLLRMSKISRIVGEAMLNLFSHGMDAKKFHCVGHSFGAHSCGIMGRELIRISNGEYKFGRITGLDAAGPGFFPPISENSLNIYDAQFVDAIHSDVFFIGARQPIAHVDFFPNYDQVQPSCPPMKLHSLYDFTNDMCSHFNAIHYWVDSMFHPKAFPCVKCANWKDYEDIKCIGNPINFMGIAANPKSDGSFFIQLTSNKNYDGRNFYQWIVKRIKKRAINLLDLKIN